MPICISCGKQSPEKVTNCIYCGAPFGHLLRNKVNEKQVRSGQLIRFAIFLVIAIPIGIASPSIYRVVGTAYLKHNLEQTKLSTIDTCGGPVTAEMDSYKREEVERCLAKNPDLVRSQQAYDNFVKSH